jgi:hypothetical protein
MTKLVTDAERRGELPPLCISPGDFASSRQQPTMTELKAARALSLLVEVLDRILNKGAFDGTPEWQVRMHKAIYRVLIAGAGLASAYNEPIFAAKSQPELELTHDQFPTHLSEKQLKFLKGFTVCDMNATPEAEEAVFGPLGAWLLETILSDQEGREAMDKRFKKGYGRARYCRSNFPNCPVRPVDGNSHADSHFVLWEVMQMLWALEHIHDVVFRGETLFGGPGTGATSALAVFFSVFHAEKVDQHLNHFNAPVLEARLACVPQEETTVYRLENARIASGKSVAVFFSQLHGLSGQPEVWAPTPDGPLTLKFFTCFLRRYLGLRVLPRPYAEFLHCIEIFSNDGGYGRKPYCGRRGQAITRRTADFLDGSEIVERIRRW